MCPTCHQVLAYSQSRIADNIRAHLHQWCAAGWTSGRVKSRLIAQFGPEIEASPPKHGFDLLAWVIPGAALLAGAAVAAALAMRWRGRRGPPPPPPPVDPRLSKRIDAELASYE
jgi:cytochrome c-type biogenesis protein CcmH